MTMKTGLIQNIQSTMHSSDERAYIPFLIAMIMQCNGKRNLNIFFNGMCFIKLRLVECIKK